QKRYSEDHEWIDTTNSESARFGITNFAAKALGDVVYVELPTVGSEVSKGDTIAAVESVKSASDIMTPASGTILEVNEELDNNPALINSGAEGEGWIASIKTSSTAEWEDLMDAEAYRKYTEELDSHD
ncbi:glycine cleavage system H protein, partial [Piedraia hortae CBS 480.64]